MSGARIVIEYRVVESTDKTAFEQSISGWLRCGWLLHGGVAIHVAPGFTTYAQAVTKEVRGE